MADSNIIYVNRYKFHSTWTARMNYHRMSIIFVLFGIVYLLSVKVTNGQKTNSQDSTGSNHSCPVLILYPSFLYATFGRRVNFTGKVEAKLEYPIEGLWQRLQHGVLLKSINQDEKKYLDTNALAPSQLVINNVNFDDEGEYRLQVRISTGWCSSNTVRLQHVYGILDYNASCNKTRECDERKHLQCSRKTCLCDDSYYPFNQTCFPKSDLRAPIYNYNISEFSMYFKWTQPTHSNLIQNYTVSIRHSNRTSITSKSVGKQTSFTFPYNFIPGYRYYVKIASNVQIHQPREQFIENSELGIILAPLPPGPIERNVSNFHPEKLHLKWTVPINNTRVDSYYITISDQHSTIITSYPSSNDLEVSTRLQPGTNYTVTLYAKSYGSYSPQYTEEIQTLRTPLLTINPSGWPDIPYLSNLEIQCIIRNISDFPPTLETKWQRNKLDVNISDAMYNGSSLDLINPKLVINRIDFDRDDDVRYQCMAQNSEGWGSSLSDIRIDVKGSIKFQKSCNNSRECLYGAHLTCSNKHCLCSYNYYHKNEVCYFRNYLQAQSVGIQSTTCDISITWNHPYQHADLVTGYEVYLQEKTENSWKSSEKIYAGNSTSYTSPCTLQSGRLYRISIRSLVLLSNPMQTITVETSFYKTILEPRKPGAIVTNLSNFSADGVHLVWEESDGFVNRYIVRIDDHEQETLDKKPTIDWDQLLLPDTLYNVTITAISYGFTTNDYHFYGRRLSLPAASFILTTKSQYTGKAFLSYGDGDYKLTGDDVTSPALRSPTTVYIGDGTEDGFNYVVIGTNGVIGLGETFNSGSIHAMDSKHVKKRQILCPFWTDLASKDNVGKVYYNTYRRGKDRASVDSAFMEKADGIVKKYFKDLKYFKATWLVKVTWENMTLYGHKEQRDVAFNVRMFMYYKVQQ
eukprot:XP_011456409.1 PREDICTED: uncharacterized protein LOC105348593 [Crassostrea gigas]